MDVVSDRYYRNSGAVPFAGTVLMLACGAVAAGVLAFLYALLCWYNPFIYLTFLGALAFGAGVGMAVLFGGRLGKVRNSLFGMVVGLGMGLLALYLAWASYFWILTWQADQNVALANVFDPVVLWQEIRLLGDDGVWNLRGWTPTGWTLYSFWLIEAGIVVVLSVLVAGASDQPFCESCNRWTDEEKSVALLRMADPERLRQDLEAERYEALDELRQGEVDGQNAIHVHVHACPQCADATYVTLAHVAVAVDKDGNTSTSSTDLIKNLWVPRELVGHLKTPLPPVAGSPAAVSEAGLEPVSDA